MFKTISKVQFFSKWSITLNDSAETLQANTVHKPANKMLKLISTIYMKQCNFSYTC